MVPLKSEERSEERDGVLGAATSGPGKFPSNAAVPVTRITARPTLYCFLVIALSVPGSARPTANLGPLKGGPLSLRECASLAWRNRFALE
jgi:hypothetical protein